MKKAQVLIAKKRVQQMDEDCDGLCVVCFKTVDIYSIGDCDHPVCYECSTRMRVLIGRNECPICRKEISQVVFVCKDRQQLFKNLEKSKMCLERRYAIYFETDGVMKAYDRLLEHPCPICPAQPFENFLRLKDHVLRVHTLFYCDLCLEHLKIFSRERRAYTRAELAQHRRKGDTDDTSHRGHPLCEFCDTRFMDQDELYRHLRKEHFYCHFCDADGLHQYYNQYPDLRQHFSSMHFLCEQGDCRNEQFTSVFRNKLDMQAHYLELHADTKQAIRQARTVDIQFTLNPPSLGERGGPIRGRGGRGRGGRGRPGRGGDDYDGYMEDGMPPAPPPPPPQHSIDINCVQNFPSLGGAAGGVGEGAPKGGQSRSFTVRAMRGNVAGVMEEFPLLTRSNPSGASVSVTTTPSIAGNSVSNSNYLPTTSVHLKVNSKKSVAEGGESNRPRGAVSIQYNRMTAAPSSTPAAPNSKQGKDDKGATRFGNITIKSKASHAAHVNGNKENTDVDDFPSLGQPSKSLGDTFRFNNAFATDISSSFRTAPLTPNVSVTKVNTVKTKDVPKPNNEKKLDKNDFPTLMPDAQQNQHMRNYHGMSSVTVPVSNSWTKTTDYVPKPQTVAKPKSAPVVDSAASTKAPKKKKATNTIQVTNSGASNGAVAQAAKKRPPRLGNVFDESDDEESKNNCYGYSSRGLPIESYTSVVPTHSSNIKMLSADEFESKKKSQLNIGMLKTSAPALSSLGDFPSLGGAPGNSKKASNTSGTGADSWGALSATKKTAKSKTKSDNISNTAMTFHSSYGESFAISPSEEINGAFTPAGRASSTSNNSRLSSASNSSNAASNQRQKKLLKDSLHFMHPPDFENRNQKLIKTISEQCGGNSEKFDKFKSLSGRLRGGSLGGQDYYQQCRQLVGRTTLLRLLPELLVLLPDIEKQQAVLSGYKELDDNNNKSSGDSLQFQECSLCGQVLCPADFTDHAAQHGRLGDDEFPSLSNVAQALQ